MSKVIYIDGMMCEHCKKSVSDALKEVSDGVRVSLEKGTATIKETKLTDKKLTSIIEDLGFEVTGIENE